MPPASFSLSEVFCSPREMVGREAELGQLHCYVAKALRGERQVVFVTGEAGIGKTTLVDTFVEQLAAQHDLWITRGQCIEQYGAGEAYMPILEALGRLGRESREEVVAALAQYAPTWLAQLPALVNLPERETLHRVLQGATRERMLREVAEALELVTVKRPLVIILEDLHWSDHSTLELLAYLAQRRGATRLFVLGTYRPAEVLASAHPLRAVVQELRGRGHCEKVRLEVLQAPAVRVYLHARFGDSVFPAEISEALYQRTGGNPLFMVNVVEHLLREGALVEEEGQWQVKPAAAALVSSVPESLRQLIGRQFARLTVEEQQVLEGASVAGAEFAVAAVAAALEQRVERVEERCERFAAEGQFIGAAGIEEWPDGTISGHYRFVHALYHDIVYERIAAARRIQVHRRIAARKEAAYGQRAGEIASELAAHFEAGRDIWRAVRYIEQAGKNAIQRYAHQEASEHVRKGIDLLKTLPDTPERAQQELALQTALGATLTVTKGYATPDVERAYARALALCRQVGETPQLFPVLSGLYVFHLLRAELYTARELAEQQLRLAQSIQDATLLLWPHNALGLVLFHLGELTSVLAHLEQSMALYDSPKHRPDRSQVATQDPQVTCLSYASWTLWYLGYPDQARKRSAEALTLARELSHPFSLAVALNFAAVLDLLLWDIPALQERTEALMTLVREQDFPFWLALGAFRQGWILAKEGQEEEGIRQMRQAMAAIRATGAELAKSAVLAWLAEAYGKAGQVEEGLTTLAEALAHVHKTGERYYEAELYRLKGELTLQKFQVASSKFQVPNPQSLTPNTQPPTPNTRAEAEAEACFQKALEIAHRQQAKSWELRAAASLSRLWQQQGKRDEAKQLLEDIYGWFSEGFETKDLQEAGVLLTALGSTIERRQPADAAAPPNTELTHSVSITSQDLHIAGTRTVGGVHPVSSTPSPTPNPQSLIPNPQVPEFLFRQEDEYWTLAFQGTVCRVKDMRGMQYLAQLLHHPNQACPALTLVSGGEITAQAAARNEQVGAEEGGLEAKEGLEMAAHAAYKQRLEELHAELEEAHAFNDIGRVESIQEAIEVVTQELVHTIERKDHTRPSRSSVERARLMVTKAIRLAINKIHTHHPALGQHLTHTVKTGTFCAYTPDPARPISWQV